MVLQPPGARPLRVFPHPSGEKTPPFRDVFVFGFLSTAREFFRGLCSLLFGQIARCNVASIALMMTLCNGDGRFWGSPGTGSEKYYNDGKSLLCAAWICGIM